MTWSEANEILSFIWLAVFVAAAAAAVVAAVAVVVVVVAVAASASITASRWSSHTGRSFHHRFLLFSPTSSSRLSRDNKCACDCCAALSASGYLDVSASSHDPQRQTPPIIHKWSIRGIRRKAEKEKCYGISIAASYFAFLALWGLDCYGTKVFVFKPWVTKFYFHFKSS